MRYTKADLLAWGKSFHYPYLVLSCTDHVGHGELAWRRLSRDKKRRQLAWKRIQHWQELVARQTA